jgi:hypothetical protein
MIILLIQKTVYSCPDQPSLVTPPPSLTAKKSSGPKWWRYNKGALYIHIEISNLQQEVEQLKSSLTNREEKITALKTELEVKTEPPPKVGYIMLI